MEQNKKESVKIVRTSKGVRDFLFDQLDRMNEGELLPSRVAVAARTVHTILTSVKAELDFAQFCAKLGKGSKIPAIQLGED